jgi:TonB family protein
VTISFHLREPSRMPLSQTKAAPVKVADSRDLGVLKAIDVIGLPPDAREKLLSRLPVRVGEPMTTEVFSRVREVVREADEHLFIAYMRVPDGIGLLITLGDQGKRVAEELARKRALEGGASSAATPEESAPKRIRVGGNVQANNLIESKRPEYPPLAKAAHIQGVVKMNVTIGEDGTVRNIEVISGHPLLVPPSMEAVKDWIYRPTLLNGKPVEVITQVEVNFTLTE